MPQRQTSSSICTTAASQGAPQAVQTADRFHLCKNLTEAVEKALARCRAEIRKSQKAKKRPTEDTSPQESAPALSTSDGKPYSAHQTERYDRYQQVIALREQGAKVKDIAQRVGLGRRTVQRWLTDGTYVETNYHHRHRSSFDRYEAYVRRRWDEYKFWNYSGGILTIILVIRYTSGGNIRVLERLMEQVEYILLANPTVSTVTSEVVETARQNLLLGPD